MSAIYFDKQGSARYVEDNRTGPQPPKVVADLDRQPVDLDHIQACHIVAAERSYRINN